MIKACPYCSNIDINKLKKEFGEKNVKTGCIGQCRSYKKEAVGLIEGELHIKQNENDFINEAKKNK